MELMTASPGVLYNVEGVFRKGPVKGKILPGFNLDTRKPLAENLKSTTAAIYSPKLASKVRLGGAIAIWLLEKKGTVGGATAFEQCCVLYCPRDNKSLLHASEENCSCPRGRKKVFCVKLCL